MSKTIRVNLHAEQVVYYDQERDIDVADYEKYLKAIEDGDERAVRRAIGDYLELSDICNYGELDWLEATPIGEDGEPLAAREKEQE